MVNIIAFLTTWHSCALFNWSLAQSLIRPPSKALRFWSICSFIFFFEIGNSKGNSSDSLFFNRFLRHDCTFPLDLQRRTGFLSLLLIVCFSIHFCHWLLECAARIVWLWWINRPAFLESYWSLDSYCLWFLSFSWSHSFLRLDC